MFGAMTSDLFKTTFAAAVVIGAVSVTAGQYLASQNRALSSQQQLARAEKPVKQSIEGLKSVLDPVATGSISMTGTRPTPILLDPCTGERKR